LTRFVPVDAGREDLLLLEVGRDEDVGLHAERGAVGGDRVGQVAGRGAREDLVAELAGARRGDRDDAVLERVRRVRGVVLDPHLAQAEALGEAGRRGSAACSRPGRPLRDDARADGPGWLASGRKSA
jgi:hypothetical protein